MPVQGYTLSPLKVNIIRIFLEAKSLTSKIGREQDLHSEYCTGSLHLHGKYYNLSVFFPYFSGPGSVVGIATGYGLDGQGIESR